jgi:membrane-associated protease RseP (regulator of RpoE activity)
MLSHNKPFGETMNYIVVLVVIGAFWLGMAAINKIVNLQRFNIEFGDVMLVWRTERLNNFLDSISQRFGSFWSIYSGLGVIASSAGIIYILYSLLNNTYKILFAPEKTSLYVQFVVPGITIPFWYPMIGLIILLFAHELSHGIIARAEKMTLKSVGLMFVVAIPGAFVEPDEASIKEARRSSRLKLYAAGSFANFLVGGLALLLLVNFVLPSLQGAADGINVTDVMEGYPADKILEKGTVIHGVDGESARTMDKFSEIMKRHKSKDTITINTDRGDFKITLASNPNNPQMGYIGINIEQNFSGHLDILYYLLYWISNLNIGIGLMNLLPITFVLDGGKMVKEYLEMILPARTATYITTGVGVFSILLLIINILPGILK